MCYHMTQTHILCKWICKDNFVSFSNIPIHFFKLQSILNRASIKKRPCSNKSILKGYTECDRRYTYKVYYRNAHLYSIQVLLGSWKIKSVYVLKNQIFLIVFFYWYVSLHSSFTMILKHKNILKIHSIVFSPLNAIIIWLNSSLVCNSCMLYNFDSK